MSLSNIRNLRLNVKTNRLKVSCILKKIAQQKFLNLLVLPTVIYYIVFNYIPMYGVIIAFKDYSYSKGIWGSDWIGFEYFINFFNSIYFERLIVNTITISLYLLIFSFPVPIVFALLLNEVKGTHFKKTIQTISYFPHFVSVVIVVGILANFLSPEDGIVNKILVSIGYEAIPFMQSSMWFRPLYVLSDIWQGFGWNSIIYLAALSSISSELYEAAQIDGAGRFKQLTNITIPGLLPTIIMLFILRIGGIMDVGFEKVMLMYNPGIYEVSDIISTYVYRKSIQGGDFGYGTAIGLFNNVINFTLIFITNKISKKISEVSLW